MNAWPTLLFLTYFLTQWIIAILSKGCKPDNFEPHNSLKLSFTNIIGLSSNFVQCEYFLESNSPDILTLCETNNWFWQFLCEGLSCFNLKSSYYLYLWYCSLCQRRTSFCMGLIFRNSVCRFLFMFWTGFISLGVNYLLQHYAQFLILFHT